MILRAGIAADIEAMVSLHATGFETGWGTPTLAEFVHSDFVIVAGEPISGFIVARKALDEAEIITLVVDPAAQRAGQGHALLTHLMSKLLKAGVDRIFLEVACDNVAAIGLYKTAGFSQIGLRKAYYQRASGPACDALVMSKQVA
jgi:[ribosomal protein S18]-alanine N-acetyltransferase